MIPVITPTEMAAIDAAADEPVEVLIERAGAAVARAAIAMLGGTYGRRVNVLAGPGNNGADGRVAARRLEAAGVRCRILDPEVRDLPAADLIIDAAYGTGLARPYRAPSASCPVLAVDIPSGVDGLTGQLLGSPLRADRTITFVALKPGLLFEPGAQLAGDVEVADIALPTDGARMHLVTDADVARWWPRRPRTAHKWHRAVWVIGGSSGMAGAPSLAASAALRSGAGMVRMSVPGSEVTDDTYGRMPTEAVGFALAGSDWSASVTAQAERFGALVVGPGLGRDPASAAQVADLVQGLDMPMVIDADGLVAMAGLTFDNRSAPVVITPHDGEFAGLTGRRPGPDRVSAARQLAADTGVHVLLKGPTTVIAAPSGDCLIVRAGDERLATAGTGDVLAGILGALLAAGAPALPAAAAAAHIHGRAAQHGPAEGLTAGDLPLAITAAVAALPGR